MNNTLFYIGIRGHEVLIDSDINELIIAGINHTNIYPILRTELIELRKRIDKVIQQ